MSVSSVRHNEQASSRCEPSIGTADAAGSMKRSTSGTELSDDSTEQISRDVIHESSADSSTASIPRAGGPDRRSDRVVHGLTRVDSAASAGHPPRDDRSSVARGSGRLQHDLSGGVRRHAALGMAFGAVETHTKRPAVDRARLLGLPVMPVVASHARARLGGIEGLDSSVAGIADEHSKPRPRTNTGSWSWAVRAPWESLTGLGCRWARSSPGSSSKRFPSRRFECEILAWLGDSLEMQHRKLATLKRRPDAVIIYSGHNEFAARFEEERDPWLDEEPRTWLFRFRSIERP